MEMAYESECNLHRNLCIPFQPQPALAFFRAPKEQNGGGVTPHTRSSATPLGLRLAGVSGEARIALGQHRGADGDERCRRKEARSARMVVNQMCSASSQVLGWADSARHQFAEL